MKKELDNSQRINAPIGAGSFNKSPDYEFVYTADDMEKDAKSLSFNPFIQEDGSSLDNNIISLTLNQCLARAYDAYNLLDINGFKGILDNMMLRGFPKIQNKITDKTQKDSDKSFESQKGSKDE